MAPPLGFAVQATKKGALPLAVDSRAKGKKVTVIENVTGDATGLLSSLQTTLGVGGTVRSAGAGFTVELQGSQVERVGAALKQLGCVKGLPKEKVKELVVERQCAYDKFLSATTPSTRKKPRAKKEEVAAIDWSLCNSACWKWHGPWPYCRGFCEQVSFDDVWTETLESRPEPAGGAPRGPPPAADKVAVDTVLRSLGMLAEVGEPVKDASRPAPRKRAEPVGPASARETRRAEALPTTDFVVRATPQPRPVTGWGTAPWRQAAEKAAPAPRPARARVTVPSVPRNHSLGRACSSAEFRALGDPPPVPSEYVDCAEDDGMDDVALGSWEAKLPARWGEAPVATRPGPPKPAGSWSWAPEEADDTWEHARPSTEWSLAECLPSSSTSPRDGWQEVAESDWVEALPDVPTWENVDAQEDVEVVNIYWGAVVEEWLDADALRSILAGVHVVSAELCDQTGRIFCASPADAERCRAKLSEVGVYAIDACVPLELPSHTEHSEAAVDESGEPDGEDRVTVFVSGLGLDASAQARFKEAFERDCERLGEEEAFLAALDFALAAEVPDETSPEAGIRQPLLPPPKIEKSAVASAPALEKALRAPTQAPTCLAKRPSEIERQHCAAQAEAARLEAQRPSADAYPSLQGVNAFASERAAGEKARLAAIRAEQEALAAAQRESAAEAARAAAEEAAENVRMVAEAERAEAERRLRSSAAQLRTELEAERAREQQALEDELEAHARRLRNATAAEQARAAATSAGAVAAAVATSAASVAVSAARVAASKSADVDFQSFVQQGLQNGREAAVVPPRRAPTKRAPPAIQPTHSSGETLERWIQRRARLAGLDGVSPDVLVSLVNSSSSEQELVALLTTALGDRPGLADLARGCWKRAEASGSGVGKSPEKPQSPSARTARLEAHASELLRRFAIDDDELKKYVTEQLKNASGDRAETTAMLSAILPAFGVDEAGIAAFVASAPY